MGVGGYCLTLINSRLLDFNELETIGAITVVSAVAAFSVTAIMLLMHCRQNAAVPVVEEEEEDGVELEYCVVCLCDVSPGDKYIKLTNCKHGFHVECINGWLKDHSTCPLCRTPVPLRQQYFSSLHIIVFSYILSFPANLWRWLLDPLSSNLMSVSCEDFSLL